jgi:hypothetical protein
MIMAMGMIRINKKMIVANKAVNQSKEYLMKFFILLN